MLDVIAVGEKIDLETISLPKFSVIKKENLNDYIAKIHGDKFAWCSKCKTLKHLHDVHTIETKSYATYQLHYFKHVNMQEENHNDYYTNKA